MAGRPVAWPKYRSWVGVTLIWFTVLLGVPLGWGADEEDWPDQIYFPQKVVKPESDTGKVQTGSTVGSTGPSTNDEKKPKKGLWPFRRDAKKQAEKEQKNQKPLTNEQITQVGPKDPPAYPDPLLRLTFPIQTEEHIIQPGFYLVRQLEKSEGERMLALTRQHQVIFKFNVSAVADAAEGPIQPIDRTAPPRLAIDARVSPDGKTLILVLTEGAKRYESQRFPTGTDPRKTLTH